MKKRYVQILHKPIKQFKENELDYFTTVAKNATVQKEKF